MEPITVFHTLNVAQADMICAHLQSAGFEARLVNDYANVNLPMATQVMGGVLIQVPNDKAEEARAFIADLEKQP